MKFQLVPRNKHTPKVIKISQLMLYQLVSRSKHTLSQL